VVKKKNKTTTKKPAQALFGEEVIKDLPERT